MVLLPRLHASVPACLVLAQTTTIQVSLLKMQARSNWDPLSQITVFRCFSGTDLNKKNLIRLLVIYCP